MISLQEGMKLPYKILWNIRLYLTGKRKDMANLAETWLHDVQTQEKVHLLDQSFQLGHIKHYCDSSILARHVGVVSRAQTANNIPLNNSTVKWQCAYSLLNSFKQYNTITILDNYVVIGQRPFHWKLNFSSVYSRIDNVELYSMLFLWLGGTNLSFLSLWQK